MKIYIYVHYALLMLSIGCSSGQPSDSQVISDMDLNKNGLIDAYCVSGKSGEQYWHPNDKTWYWDRGVVVKRKANISGAPDAVVVVRGLARYHVNNDGYIYYKFLTTDNRYEGIPAPSESELMKIVKDQLSKVFMGKAHNIIQVKSIELTDEPWIWHNGTSFTATFDMEYEEIVSNTDVVNRKSQFEIRFYRDQVDSPIKNLLASESDRKDISRTTYTREEINRMKSAEIISYR